MVVDCSPWRNTPASAGRTDPRQGATGESGLGALRGADRAVGHGQAEVLPVPAERPFVTTVGHRACSVADATEESVVVVREQPTCGSRREVGHGRHVVALVDSADARIDNGLEHGDGQLRLRMVQFADNPGECLVQ